MKIVLLVIALASMARSQVSSGTILGQVKDESGRVVAGAAVTAQGDNTGFKRATVSDTYGDYRLENLPPGVYSIRATHAGFKVSVAPRLTLEVNQYAKLDFLLTIGETHDSVEVSAAVSPLRTQDSSVGYRIDSQTLAQLPLDERNVMSLLTVGPGAIPRQLSGFVHDSNNDIQQGSRGSVALNPPVNGARPEMNLFLLDGAMNTDGNTFAVAVVPPMDSVQEFRTQTSMASSAYSRGGGGVVDLVTKSGGRQFHGSGFEYLRNEATDARNFFDNPLLPRSIFRRNQFGGSLGGPLPLPSTLFFATYEGLRGKSASPARQVVPDAPLRAGNFSGGNILYDPLNLGQSGMRVPFSGNVIPVDRIDPIARKYLDQFEPLPNVPGDPSGNYIDTTPSTNDHDRVSGRIDRQFQKGSLLFGRYTVNDERGGIGGNFPLRPTSEKLRAQQAVLDYTLPGVSWSNEIRASLTRLRLFDVPLNASHENVAANLGILNPPSDPFSFGLPYFFVANYSTVTDDPTLPQTQRDNTWGVSDSFSMIRGRRTYKVGFEGSEFQFNYRQSNTIRGMYTYGGAFTGNGADPTGGDPLADFLLGFPQFTRRSVGNSQGYLRRHGFAGFAQQDWQVTRSFALTLGLRYECTSPFKETRGALLNLDYSKLPQAPSLVNVTRASEPNRTDFAPRVGIAWRLPSFLSSRGSTVFRAGYGIYLSPAIALESYELVLNGIANQMNSTDGTGLPLLTTRDGFPTTASTGFPSYFGLDQQLPTPYVQQWNAGLQHELPGGVVLEASYIGSKGTQLPRFRRFNTALHTETGENLDPRAGDLQSMRTFPSLGPIFQFQHIANSSYHSLQIKGEKRYRKSLTFLGSFVWSKSIDDSSAVVPSLFDSGGAQDERNLRLERALSAFHVGRRVSGAFVYGLPATAMFSHLLQGWDLSGVITIQDGMPFDPLYVSSDTANAGTFTRPDLVPGQSISLPASQRTAGHWFNTDAFAAPAPFHFGNAGRNTILGPGNQQIDLAVHKHFKLSERAGLEFRAEGFNVLNHPNVGFPAPYPDFGPFFGKLLIAGQPRRIQFATRIEF